MPMMGGKYNYSDSDRVRDDIVYSPTPKRVFEFDEDKIYDLYYVIRKKAGNDFFTPQEDLFSPKIELAQRFPSIEEAEEHRKNSRYCDELFVAKVKTLIENVSE